MPRYLIELPYFDRVEPLETEQEDEISTVKRDLLREQESCRATYLAPFELVLSDLLGQIRTNDDGDARRDDCIDIYYDTAKLDLVRFGAVLRHRTSEDRKFWNVQFLAKKGDRYIIRREFDDDTQSLEIPETLMGLLYAFHRSHLLMQIGQVRVAQEIHELRDAKGVVFAEIADRSISSSGVLWQAQRFREITFRGSIRSKKDRHIRDTFGALMLDHGGVSTSPKPEILRILGPELTSPFAITRSPPNPHESVYSILQRAIAISAVRLLRFDPGLRLSADPENVHEYRVSVRRLRSDLRSFSSVIDPKRANVLRSELAWLGGEVGKVRDSDVLVSHIHKLALRCMNEDRPGIAILQTYLDDLSVKNRQNLLEVLKTERYASLVGVTIDLASGATSIENAGAVNDIESPKRSSKQIIRSIVRKRWRRFARSAHRINAGSTDPELHRVRLLAKRCRYIAETALPLFGDPITKFSNALAEVQDLLGRYHDCAVQEIWLREHAGDLPDSRVAIGELILLMRQERELLRTEWPAVMEKASSAKLRRWLNARDN